MNECKVNKDKVDKELLECELKEWKLMFSQLKAECSNLRALNNALLYNAKACASKLKTINLN